jgi:hypothetical protein
MVGAEVMESTIASAADEPLVATLGYRVDKSRTDSTAARNNTYYVAGFSAQDLVRQVVKHCLS